MEIMINWTFSLELEENKYVQHFGGETFRKTKEMKG
jgi:hypothetical protein